MVRTALTVTLYEKNSQVGGRCQSMQSTKVDGYRWDTGPSLLLLPKKYE
ncbi:Phytoene desaturase, partial [Symbiodinium microadriaticum]